MIREVEELESPNPYLKRIEFYQSDTVLGYLEYSLIYDRMEIDNFFVEESYRRCGIGKKLMSYLVATAIDNHVLEAMPTSDEDLEIIFSKS